MKQMGEAAYMLSLATHLSCNSSWTAMKPSICWQCDNVSAACTLEKQPASAGSAISCASHSKSFWRKPFAHNQSIAPRWVEQMLFALDMVDTRRLITAHHMCPTLYFFLSLRSSVRSSMTMNAPIASSSLRVSRPVSTLSSVKVPCRTNVKMKLRL